MGKQYSDDGWWYTICTTIWAQYIGLTPPSQETQELLSYGECPNGECLNQDDDIGISDPTAPLN